MGLEWLSASTITRHALPPIFQGKKIHYSFLNLKPVRLILITKHPLSVRSDSKYYEHDLARSATSEWSDYLNTKLRIHLKEKLVSKASKVRSVSRMNILWYF